MTSRGANKDVRFRFVGDARKLQKAGRQAERALESVQAKSQRVGAKLQGFGRQMSLKVGLPIVAAFTAGAKSLIENERLLAQTRAAIKSTGGAAGKTAAELLDMAMKLSNLSGAAHESVLEGENMLLTFTNIRNELGESNDIFDQTTLAVLDMATATGTDMKSAAIQLGKALNDPVANLGALSRVGITFTQSQKDMIKELANSNDLLGAQKIILGELTTEFGGSAEAAGDTMAGALNRMKNSAEEMARGLASIVIPALEGATGALQTVFDWFNKQPQAVKTAISSFALLLAALGPAGWITGKIIAGFGAIRSAYETMYLFMLAHPIVPILGGVAALVGAVALSLTSDFSPAVEVAVKAGEKLGLSYEQATRTIERFGLKSDLAAEFQEVLAKTLGRGSEGWDAYRRSERRAHEQELLTATAIGMTAAEARNLIFAAERSAAATSRLTDASEDHTEALEKERDRIREVARAEREAADPIFALFAAQQRLTDAQTTYNEVQVNTEASAEDVRSAMLDVVSAAGDLRFAQKDAALGLSESEEAFRNMALAAGLSSDEIRQLIDLIKTLNTTPVSPRTVVGGGGAPIRAMQHGGTAHPGETVLTGEAGPELVTAGRSGATVTPIRGGGSQTLNIYIGEDKVEEILVRANERIRRRGRR